tara:strand:+ start:1864 stop:2070 length:207 start_codon:yes stop_codon:yes gene_type:complete
MPLPTKNSGEEKNSFVQRCMSDDIMKQEFSDSKQRVAVCLSQYKKRKKTSNAAVKWDSIRKGDALGLI